MKKLRNILFVVFFLCGVAVTFPTTVNAATSGDFTYTISGYTATITGCNSNVAGAVEIPNKLDNYLVTAIGKNAFADKSKITSVIMPDTVTSIDNFAFSGCTGLESITFSDNLVSLGFQALEGCSSLKRVIIPNNTTYLGRSVFSGCDSLEEISIPFVGIESGEYTKLSRLFYEYPNSLKKVVVTGGSSIVKEAFADCKTLESVVLPGTLTSIGETPFAKCEKLSSITVDPSNTKYHSQGNCIIETATKTLVQGCNDSTIPDDGSVKTIGPNAFRQLTGLKKVVIPNSVTRIEEYAFYQCNSIEEMSIPFAGNTLNGSSNTNFGYIFGYSRTSHGHLPVSLKKITITGNCKLSTDCFSDCESLKEIVIGDGVSKIGHFAFLQCEALEKVTIGSGVSTIQTAAFLGCVSLKEIVIPNNVRMIEQHAFSECGKLTSVTINNPSIDLRTAIFEESSAVKIYCTKGSSAEKYAKSNNIPYEYITQPTQSTTPVQIPTVNNSTGNTQLSAIPTKSPQQTISKDESVGRTQSTKPAQSPTANSISNNNSGKEQQSSNPTKESQQPTTKGDSVHSTQNTNSARNPTAGSDISNNMDEEHQTSNSTNGSEQPTSKGDIGDHTQESIADSTNESDNEENVSSNNWGVACIVIAAMIVLGGIVFFVLKKKHNTSMN